MSIDKDKIKHTAKLARISLDEKKIDVNDLKDKIIFGNSFNNIAYLLERDEKIKDLERKGLIYRNGDTRKGNAGRSQLVMYSLQKKA